MSCISCKGAGIIEPKLTVYTVESESGIIIIKNVPSLVCRQCGAIFYDDDVVINLEFLIAELKKTINEVVVTTYQVRAA